MTSPGAAQRRESPGPAVYCADSAPGEEAARTCLGFSGPEEARARPSRADTHMQVGESKLNGPRREAAARAYFRPPRGRGQCAPRIFRGRRRDPRPLEELPEELPRSWRPRAGGGRMGMVWRIVEGWRISVGGAVLS